MRYLIIFFSLVFLARSSYAQSALITFDLIESSVSEFIEETKTQSAFKGIHNVYYVYFIDNCFTLGFVRQPLDYKYVSHFKNELIVKGETVITNRPNRIFFDLSGYLKPLVADQEIKKKLYRDGILMGYTPGVLICRNEEDYSLVKTYFKNSDDIETKHNVSWFLPTGELIKLDSGKLDSSLFRNRH